MFSSLNRVFVTLQSCLNEIIDCDGGNQHKIPHMNKDRLERLGQLPVSLEVTEDAEYVWGAEEGDDEEEEEEEGEDNMG